MKVSDFLLPARRLFVASSSLYIFTFCFNILTSLFLVKLFLLLNLFVYYDLFTFVIDITMDIKYKFLT